MISIDRPAEASASATGNVVGLTAGLERVESRSTKVRSLSMVSRVLRGDGEGRDVVSIVDDSLGVGSAREGEVSGAKAKLGELGAPEAVVDEGSSGAVEPTKLAISAVEYSEINGLSFFS